MDCLLGIDVGTSSLKCTLFTGNGDFVDIETRPYPVDYPGEGRAEQNPEDWWRALVSAVKAVVARNRGTCTVRAMSLSTQGGCTLLLDDGFRPLCSAVSWLDTRAAETVDVLSEHITEDELYRQCGWAGFTGMNLAVAVWFRERMPELYRRTRYVCSTVEFMNHRLTGSFSIDLTNMALTSLLDLESMDWSDRALGMAGIDRSMVAGVVRSGNVVGVLRLDVTRELGVSEDVVLVSGAHDQYCANIGAGAVDAGDCVLSTGTAWVMTVTSDRMVFNSDRTIHPCAHVLDGRYGLMTTVVSGGNSVAWFRDTFRPDAGLDDMSSLAGAIEPGSGGLLFIPKGVHRTGGARFVNIDNAHGTGHFMRAVFEGVAFANKQHLRTLSAEGVAVRNIIMTGGGAGSRVWPRIVADVSGIPLTISLQKEAACAGAAMLAGVGCGMYTTIAEAARGFASKTEVIEPDGRLAERYATLFASFLDELE